MEDRWGTRPSDGLSTGEHCQVVLMSIPPGGADVIRQALRAGHVEELAISIAPVILGGGKRPVRGL
ncbi:MAG TPA: dihydrofolate reductase family protein [Actinomycetota bacterium]|nr:dihydrofolate reductase family protein [Actinomycetota bacterium]